MNKPKILFVLPTLKQDGAEVQISNLLSCFENFKVDIFTFDLFKEGSSIFGDLQGIKVYTKNRNTNLRALKKVIESNEYNDVSNIIEIITSIRSFKNEIGVSPGSLIDIS